MYSNFFSEKVNDYTKGRPGYPPQIIEYLKLQCNLTKQSSLVEIGSGTGKFTELLLAEGYTVKGISSNFNLLKLL